MLKYSKSTIRELKKKGYSDSDIEAIRRNEEEVDGWKKKAWDRIKNMTAEERAEYYKHQRKELLKRFGIKIKPAPAKAKSPKPPIEPKPKK